MSDIQPHISSTQWRATDEGPGEVEHHYIVPNAPWLGRETIPHPVPDHLIEIVKYHAEKHAPIVRSDGKRTLRLEPEVRSINVISRRRIEDGQWEYVAEVGIRWSQNGQEPFHGISYTEVLPSEHRRPHHAHRLAVERRINVDLDGHHGLVD